MRSAGLLFIMARLGECMYKCTGYLHGLYLLYTWSWCTWYVSTVLVMYSVVYMYVYLNQWAYNCLCLVIGFDMKDGSQQFIVWVVGFYWNLLEYCRQHGTCYTLLSIGIFPVLQGLSSDPVFSGNV